MWDLNFYEWHYLDLIVTFLWMTLSRSNCEPFYEQYYLDVNCDQLMTFLWTTLDLNCDLFMNDTI